MHAFIRLFNASVERTPTVILYFAFFHMSKSLSTAFSWAGHIVARRLGFNVRSRILHAGGNFHYPIHCGI